MNHWGFFVLDDGRLWYLLVTLVFLAFCCFFSLSAAAMIGVNDADLKERTENGDSKAKRLSRCLALPDIADRIRTTAFVCAMLAEIPALVLASEPLYQLFVTLSGIQLEDGRISHPLLLGSVAICAVLLTFAVISVGIKIPQFLGTRYCERLGYGVAKFFPGVLWIFLPLTGPIRGFSVGVAKLLGADPRKTAETVTEEEIRMLVDTGSEMGFIEESQKEMINNIFEFDDTTVGDVMTHRTEIVAVEKDAKVSEVVYLATSEGFSRLPVYEKDLDNILGFIHVKDLLCLVGCQSCGDLNISDFIRPVIYVPEHTKCRNVFAEFKKSQTAMAVVVDEYGGTEGIITMEDILEAIVGDIEDEYDEEEKNIQQIDNDTFVVEGTVELEDLDDLLKITFEEDEDYDTLGGFMTHMLGRIPGEDENPSIEYQGYRFTVMLVEERRVAKVKIQRLEPPAQEEEEQKPEEKE